MITIYRNDPNLEGYPTVKSYYLNKKGDAFDVTMTESYAYVESNEPDSMLYAKLVVGKGFTMQEALDVIVERVNEGLLQGYSLTPSKRNAIKMRNSDEDVQVSVEG